jgi:hypothetical protein
MNKLNLPHFVKVVRTTMSKHSPEILTGIGIAGMIFTTISAVKATPKALERVETRKCELEDEVGHSIDKLPKTEVIKAAWTCYIPSAITGSLSIACLVGATSVNAKRNAVLATAYTLSETAFNEYREKVIETVGEKKEETIRDKVAQERIDKNPVKNNEVIITNRGNTLCYDAHSARYFRGDIETIRKAVNELNRRMISEMCISLNDFYYEIGLRPTKLGDDMGWNINNGFIELHFSSHLNENEEPCLAIDYYVAPMYNYASLM